MRASNRGAENEDQAAGRCSGDVLGELSPTKSVNLQKRDSRRAPKSIQLAWGI